MASEKLPQYGGVELGSTPPTEPSEANTMREPSEANTMREPEDIIAEAVRTYAPTRMFVGMSGGNDSMTVTHWMMTHVPGCEVFHIDTGIGIAATRKHVQDTCAAYGWPLTVVRAKEDAGQDYDDLVMRHGFPGPAGHGLMYRRLKERSIRILVRRVKQRRMDKILIATGIYQGESKRRAGYADRVINKVGAQLWVNPLYFWTADRMAAYRKTHDLPVNPVSRVLGMSGECLCGAFAHKGEKALIRLVCPATAERLDRLEEQARAAGHEWGWEDRPPKGYRAASRPGPLCNGCGKSE